MLETGGGGERRSGRLQLTTERLSQILKDAIIKFVSELIYLLIKIVKERYTYIFAIIFSVSPFTLNFNLDHGGNFRTFPINIRSNENNFLVIK